MEDRAAHPEEQSEVHRLEPYVYAQMIAGKDAVRHGEAKNSWLTGTAAWNSVAISQYLLCVRPDFDGLRVHPCLGAEIGKFTVTRKCRGAEYRIHVKNSAEGGAPKLTVDGKPISGDLVPYATAAARPSSSTARSEHSGSRSGGRMITLSRASS